MAMDTVSDTLVLYASESLHFTDYYKYFYGTICFACVLFV